MTLISTSALRKITIVVLAIAVASFASAEIHRRFVAPRQQAAAPTPSPAAGSTVPTPTPRPTPPWQVIPGRVKKVENYSITLTTSEGEKEPYAVSHAIPVYRIDPRNPESSFPFEDMYSDDFSKKSAVSKIDFSGIKIGDVAYLVFKILPNQDREINKIVVSEVIEE